MIPKEEIFKIGREDDRRIREEQRRADSTERQRRVDQARSNLYEHGYSLTGDYVDGALKDGSLVPTKVGDCLSRSSHYGDPTLERLLTGSVQVWV